MGNSILPLLRRAWSLVRDDLRSDPRLKYILLLSFFVSAFWFWWRMPNFVSADEFRRVGQPMKVARYLVTDPGVDAIRRLAEEEAGRDATTYLHGFVLFPLFVLIVLTGKLDTLVGVSGAESVFDLWNSVPGWFWTASLTLTRLLNIALVVGSVYIVYRIGTVLTDRRAGRIAAVFMSLSLGVIHTAHEVNEDTPGLFLLLVVLYLAIRYVHTEDQRYFLLGCGLGGLAIAFKLTAGVAVFFLAVAFLLTALDKSDPVAALWQPRLLTYGLLLGVVTIYVGIPNLLLRGPEWLIESRIIGGQASKTVGAGIPIGYSAAIAYLNGLGFPLAVGAATGLVATLRRIGLDRDYNSGELVLLVGLAVYLGVYFGLWQNFRTHHVLLSIPLLVLVFGRWLSRWYETRTDIAHVVFAVLLLTTALYAGAGLYQLTNDPRDEAADWLESEADPQATVTVFDNSPASEGLVHGRPIDHYPFGRAADFPDDPYTDWLLSTPEREPEYIQLHGIRGSNQFPRRAEFEDRLLNGDHYGYVVVAEFGERPESQGRTSELLYAGVVPKLEKRSSYKLLLAKNESLA